MTRAAAAHDFTDGQSPDVAGQRLAPAAPLYREVQRQLMAALARAEWKPGAALPSERRLAERYGTSIGTVRKAVDELCAGNILIRQQGRGTYVATHGRDRSLFYFFHVVPERGVKVYPDVELLAFARGKADRVAAERLRQAPGEPVVRLRNLLRLAGAPVIVDDITLAAARFPGLSERDLRARPSTLYNLYQQAFGISVVQTRERLRAVPAEADVAALLDLPTGAPLLQIRRVALGYHDEPVEYRVSHVDTSRHEYYAEIGA